MPLTYLVPKGREEDGRRTFARTPHMVAHFSEVTGVAYPWKKYAQVVANEVRYEEYQVDDAEVVTIED